ncbi:MAG: hypothetical protein J5902_08260 [Paludibacteraceae bacterium]|nr:hypothetical protein [Paludibacteraceae bacterium]
MNSVQSSLRYARLHWRILARKTLADALSWLFLSVTLVGSLIAFLPEQEAETLRAAVRFCISSVWPLLLIVLLLVGIAMMVNYPRTKAVYRDANTGIRVIVECCDMLHQGGLKVIHTVDTFDTALGTVISPRSLHGAFLKICEANNVDVDGQIDRSLRAYKPTRTNKNLPGRKDQYALGTICPVDVQDEPFCCVAFTHLQPNGTIEISKDEYIKCMKRMWRNLADPRLRHDTVNVAVMGNSFVDLPPEFSTEQKIDLMLQTFFSSAREKKCCATLRICVHPNNVSDIDFEHYPVIMEHLAKRPII